MKERLFEKTHHDDWLAFEETLLKFEGNKNKKQLIESSNFPYQYRQICNQLTLARDRQYNSALIQKLEQLALRGHQVFYGARTDIKFAAVKYLFYEFPALIRKEWRVVLLSHILFYLPGLVILVLGLINTDIPHLFLGGGTVDNLNSMYEPSSEHFKEQREIGSDVYMWGFYIFNNVRIDLQCFAGGILGTLGSIFFIVFNGLFFGAASAHIINVGYESTFFSFVIGHSGLELTAAVLSGAAGIKMGYALINPGRLTRMKALKANSIIAVRMLYGAAFMTFLAAFIEAYWSSNIHISNTVKYIFGGTMWLLILLYFLFAGKRYATR